MYFVTVCTHRREARLGTLVGGTFLPHRAGLLVLDTWRDLPRHYPGLALDAFAVLPDHVHAVVRLGGSAAPLFEVVRAFKTFSARRINAHDGTAGCPVWQRSFHDRIVRSQREWNAVRAYVARNPWKAWIDT